MNRKTVNIDGKKGIVIFDFQNIVCDGKQGWDGSSTHRREFDVVLQGGLLLGRMVLDFDAWHACHGAEPLFEMNGRRYVNEKKLFEGEMQIAAARSAEAKEMVMQAIIWR